MHAASYIKPDNWDSGAWRVHVELKYSFQAIGKTLIFVP